MGRCFPIFLSVRTSPILLASYRRWKPSVHPSKQRHGLVGREWSEVALRRPWRLSESPAFAVYFMPACHSSLVKRAHATIVSMSPSMRMQRSICYAGSSMICYITRVSLEMQKEEQCREGLQANTDKVAHGQAEGIRSFSERNRGMWLSVSSSAPRRLVVQRSSAAMRCCRMSTSQDQTTFARGKRWSLSAASFFTRSLSVANSMTPLFSWIEAAAQYSWSSLGRAVQASSS